MIFEEQLSRKPNLYPWTEKFIEAIHGGFWTDKEFSFLSDVQDFNNRLTEDQKKMAIRALSAIGQIEIAVKTFWAKIGENLPHPAIYDLGLVMANSEVIHNKAYERLLTVLGIEDIFEENLKLEIIANRVKYLRKYTHKFYKDSKKQYIYALALFTMFVEGVSLFSQFYTIKWFGRSFDCDKDESAKFLKDTNQQVNYTLFEETLHLNVGTKFINTIKEEYPDLFDEEMIEKIKHESLEAFKAESKIIDWMVGEFNHEYLSAEILKEFVKYRINYCLDLIGIGSVFELDKEKMDKVQWFNEFCMASSSTDFFHQKPTGYSKNNKVFDFDSLFD